LLTTFTLYLHDDSDGSTRFEPLLCEPGVAMVAEVRKVLAQNPSCARIDVFMGDREVLQLAR
jgi:hypothetical protein